MYCELQRKQKPVPNRSTGNKKLQKIKPQTIPGPSINLAWVYFPSLMVSLMVVPSRTLLFYSLPKVVCANFATTTLNTQKKACCSLLANV